MKKWFKVICFLIIALVPVLGAGCKVQSADEYLVVKLTVQSNGDKSMAEARAINESVKAVKGLIISNYEKLDESELQSVVQGIFNFNKVGEEIAVKIYDSLKTISVIIGNSPTENEEYEVHLPIIEIG